MALDFVWALGLAMLFLVVLVVQKLFPLHEQEESKEADK
jgi:hypothetical protein